MRAARGWIIAGLLVAAAVVGGIVWSSRPKIVEVRVARVAKGKVEETVSSTKAGAVRSRLDADLSSDVSGLITAVHAREGAIVKKDSHLVSIDKRDAEAALTAAQKDVKTLEALASEAATRHRDAVRELKRLEGLKPTGDVSEAQLDQAATLAEAMAAAKAAAEARIEAGKAAVVRAQIAVDKGDLHAPFDGIVAAVFVEVGEWAVPGKVMMRLVDLDHLYIRAELDEVDLGPLKVGMPARVTLDPYKGRKPMGAITRIAPYVSEAQEQNRTLEVEVELKEPMDGLKPGISADVEVILRERDGVLRIPSQALMEGDRVLVAGADGIARATAVKIGLRNWEFAEVLEGVAEGDAVIVSLEIEAAKDGARVKIRE